MDLNKNTSYVLTNLLNGHTTSSEIKERLKSIDIRSVQRALNRLVELRLVIKSGTNHPSYSVNYENLIQARIKSKLLENVDRPNTSMNFKFIEWLANPTRDLESILEIKALNKKIHSKPMTAKELEYLTVELSWKSSALEGNTYTLLDTQLLLVDGIKAKNRTEFETQMILNHKNVIAFIIENDNLFTDNIKFSSVEKLHSLIAENLGMAKGVRKMMVKISASNYIPLSNPRQLRELADDMLSIINKAEDPVLKSLLAFALIPYLQTFEDGNKRTGRMLANAILIQSLGIGFSLRKVSAKQLALAYLAFYEFNSIDSLKKIITSELSNKS